MASRIGDEALVHARDAWERPVRRNESCLVLLCPTYGDAELQDEFEEFLLKYDWTLCAGTPFAFCELGIYTGYEDFGHGLAGIVCSILQRHGLYELVPPLAIDAVPITDWHLVDVWCDLIISRARPVSDLKTQFR